MKFKKDKINLRRKKTWIYYSIIMFMFIGFFSLMTSKLYIKTEAKIYQTEQNQELPLTTTGTLSIQNWGYNPKENVMEIMLNIQGEGDKYIFKAQEKVNPNIQLPVKTVYKNNEDYVLHVKEVSSNWEALALDIYQINSEEQTAANGDEFTENDTEQIDEKGGEQTLLKTLYADQGKIKINENMKEKKRNEYTLYFVDLEKKETEMKLKEHDKKIEFEEKKQEELTNEIDELKSEMKYQTEVEKIDTKFKINTKENEISQSEQSVETYLFEQKNMREKIKKLEEEEKDLSKKQGA